MNGFIKTSKVKQMLTNFINNLINERDTKDIIVIFLNISFLILRIYITLNIIPIMERGLASFEAKLIFIIGVTIGMAFWAFGMFCLSYACIKLKPYYKYEGGLETEYPPKFYSYLLIIGIIVWVYSIFSSGYTIFGHQKPVSLGFLSPDERFVVTLDVLLYFFPIILTIPSMFKIWQYEKIKEKG